MTSSISTLPQSPAAQHSYLFPYQSNSVVACVPFHPKLGGVCIAGIRNGSRLRCNCSLTPGGSGSGENESKGVLDAFFLGKAVAEALNERIESTVGEILSTVGRLQAEQQKQVQEFQEEVLERAKRAKEKAAREAKVAQGLSVNSTITTTSPMKWTSTNSSAAGPSSTAIKPNNKDSGSSTNDTVTDISNNL